MEDKLAAPCGTHCKFCAYYRKEKRPSCSGCDSHKGHPFWGECKLYACANEHQIEHCGLCKEFLCDLFVNQYDPEHGQESVFTRAGLLAYRRKVGVRKYTEMAKKIAEEA